MHITGILYNLLSEINVDDDDDDDDDDDNPILFFVLLKLDREMYLQACASA